MKFILSFVLALVVAKLHGNYFFVVCMQCSAKKGMHLLNFTLLNKVGIDAIYY